MHSISSGLVGKERDRSHCVDRSDADDSVRRGFAPADLAPADLAPADPAPADLAPADPTPADPAPADPAQMGLVPTEPAPEISRLQTLRAALAMRMAACNLHGSSIAAEHVETPWPVLNAALGGGLRRAGLHEWWGEISEVRSVLIQLAWNALRHDEVHSVGSMRRVAWVGRAIWPHAHELIRGERAAIAGMFGGKYNQSWPDAQLHDRSLLIDVAAHDSGARLWAIEQASRCSGVCLVIADGRDFDLPATRRLQLAASNVLLLSIRGAEQRPNARRNILSACSTRWHVSRSCESGKTLAERLPWLVLPHRMANRLPAEPSWRVTLERAKGASIHAQEESGVRAYAASGWQGNAVQPSAQAKALRRRAARIEQIVHGQAQAKRRKSTSESECGAGTRHRSSSRMTSRGERWAEGARQSSAHRVA